MTLPSELTKQQDQLRYHVRIHQLQETVTDMDCASAKLTAQRDCINEIERKMPPRHAVVYRDFVNMYGGRTNYSRTELFAALSEWDSG
jgi:hypothetical protein